MRKAISKIAAAGGGAALMLSHASAALAQWETDYYYDSTASDAAGLGFTGVWMFVWCCMGILGLAVFVFWLMMFLHVLKNAPDSEKTLWVLLMLGGLLFGFGWLVALIYFFTKKKEWEGNAPAKVENKPEAPKTE